MRRKSRKGYHSAPNVRRQGAKTGRVEDEPQPEGEEWVEWGGELIWAAGFTAGGTPYGLTVDQFREGNAREGRAHGPDWARAKWLLRDAFERRVGRTATFEIGWVRFLGDGLCRKAFLAEMSLRPDPESLSDNYVVLLPRPDAERAFDERARSEARLLTRLAALDLPLRIPKILGLLSDHGRPAIIETAVPGVPLDLRAGRQLSLLPWEVVAQVAATVHTLNGESLSPDWKMPGFRTWRDHALASLSIFESRPEPLLRDIHTWALENLPPDEPSVLLHGDLLGQNILITPGEPLGLIDWEWAQLGDPAYDLSIVTRGARRPFQIPGGLNHLLEAYAARSSEIKKEHVHLYELCMIARWYVESLQRERERGAPAGGVSEPVGWSVPAGGLWKLNSIEDQIVSG